VNNKESSRDGEKNVPIDVAQALRSESGRRGGGSGAAGVRGGIGEAGEAAAQRGGQWRRAPQRARVNSQGVWKVFVTCAGPRCVLEATGAHGESAGWCGAQGGMKPERTVGFNAQGAVQGIQLVRQAAQGAGGQREARARIGAGVLCGITAPKEAGATVKC
jgi:hypothetical protein